MKAALIISGYLRSIQLNIQNIKEKIINKFDSVDVYIHITTNEEDDKYLNINDKNIILELEPKSILYESNYIFTHNKKENDLINTWFKYYKLNEIKKLNEIDKKYDIVIKYRPDLNINTNINFDIKDDIIYIPQDSKIDKSKLKHEDDKYICDIFAYGSSDMMDKYFSIYKNIFSLIEKYGDIPETILYYHLTNIKYELIDLDYNVILSVCNIFSITGDSGCGKTKLSNIIKKHFSKSFLLECDRYHKWERENENWKNITHLNPDANFIAKMKSDIFNLKIGNTIYGVNYDHNTGKFTDKETIQSSDNIIVCGLHNLYENTKHLYNLKIFIDTDENLKYRWKIKRDMNERGYTMQNSMKQIENRTSDYEKYILPQREESDLIINFFTHKEFNINNLDDGYDISLKVFISNKYNIHKIINKLNHFNINYNSYINENNFEIIFNTYENNNITFGNISNENNYYDYIMLIIHNMIK